MKSIVFLTVLVVLLLAAGPGAALDLDALFGDELIVLDDGSDASRDPALLQRDPVELGGSLRMSLEYSHLTPEVPGRDSFQARTSGSLFADIRFNHWLRTFAKGSWNLRLHPPRDEPLQAKLDELFVDLHWNYQVYVRAGKQNVQWGVGYFFSPADVISIGRIDPQNPSAAREGPTALRVHVPRRFSDYYVFVIADEAETWQDLALAPRVSFVAGLSEISVGGFFKLDKVPRAMATVSTSLGNTAVFAEAMASLGSDKLFVEADPGSPLGYRVVQRTEPIFQGTIGATRQFSDDAKNFQITAAAQYFFNGEGYRDRSFMENPLTLGLLLATTELSLADLNQTGRHYAAASLNWSRMFNTAFSSNVLWLGNLSDRSGQVTLSLSYGRWDYFRPRVGYTQFYGPDFSEFGLLDRQVFVGASLINWSF